MATVHSVGQASSAVYYRVNMASGKEHYGKFIEENREWLIIEIDANTWLEINKSMIETKARIVH